MIAKEIVYRTDDGTTFDNIEEAKGHELLLDAEAMLNEVLAPAVRTGRAEAVIRSMIANHEAVRKILVSYSKRLPKSRQLAQAA